MISLKLVVLVLIQALLIEISILALIGVAYLYPPPIRLTILLMGIVVLIILTMIWSDRAPW